MDFEHILGVKPTVLVAGLIGGIISLTYEEKMSAHRAMILIMGGAFTAAYLHPMIELYFGAPDKISAGLGFILGLTSMKILDFIIQNTGDILQIVKKYVFRDIERNNSTAGSRGDNPPFTTRVAGKKEKDESQ